MPHTCSCFCSEEVSARRFEELEDGLVLPYGRVCDIDYDLCSGQCVSQTFSCNGVDARGGRARHNFVAALAKVVYDLRSDKATAANDDDFHFLIHGVLAFWLNSNKGTKSLTGFFATFSAQKTFGKSRWSQIGSCLVDQFCGLMPISGSSSGWRRLLLRGEEFFRASRTLRERGRSRP